MDDIPMASSMRDKIVLSIEDIQEQGSKKLPKSARDFFNSGATSQVTVHENNTAFKKYRLRPRVLVNVSKVDPSTTVFGSKISFPVCVSPTGNQAMAHMDGELATSRACAKYNIHMGVSSFANHSIEEVREASNKVGTIKHAMQLYTMKDRVLQERVIKRAEAAGCVAILLTGDSPALGVRYNEWRNDFRTPPGLGFPMMEKSSQQILAQTHDAGFLSMNSDYHSWADDIPWIRSKTKMEIWIKGVLTAEDVLLAREYGCDGVVVSNHGGRQLDDSPATIDALPECVKAAEGKIRIHIDGGIRSGADIFKALAMGAECCWIGRPVLWGLAYNGEKGVEKVLEVLYGEFRRVMMFTGCTSVADISRAKIGIAMANGPLGRL